MEENQTPGHSRWNWWNALVLGGLALVHLLLLSSGKLPVDTTPYFRAAQRLEQGKPLYSTIAQSRQHWQTMHRSTLVYRDRGGKTLDMVPGPYVYPPTLALWLKRLHLPPALFLLLLFVGVLSFLWVWRQQIPPEKVAWLALGLSSWDTLSSLSGGNLELLLLGAAALACWFLWREKPLWAAPLIALTFLCKPFYGILYLAFGAHWWVQQDSRNRVFRILLSGAVLSFVFIGLDILFWGSSLREQAWNYYQHALQHQWMTLPLAQQFPMSLWNRTLMQGLVSLHIPAHTAQWLSPTLWFGVLAASLWWNRNKRSSFAWLFAVALVLFYWGRPVGWTFPFLEMVMLGAVLPLFRSERGKMWFGWIVLLYFASHWGALFWTAITRNLQLLTPQVEWFPWETWLLLPSCLVLLSMLCKDEHREKPVS